ncbi:sensor histidine kinase [Spongiimicrobium salis]|uniref:sensor histidine kinase n=1 Tax=Spongiimicrobium salis TaxID=1667022 RepID=UPI00374CD6D8
MKKPLQDHIIFWTVLLISFTLIQFFKDDNSQPLLGLLLENTKRLPAMLLAAHVFNELLLPRYYRTKKYLVFGVLTVFLFYLATALDRLINIYVYETLFREPPFERESIQEILSDVYFLFVGYLSPLVMATAVMAFEGILRQKRQIEKKNLQLERDKNTAELQALKSQLHPHFLFNTLNNLYTLTLQKSDKAPEIVATLSNMLDYILYQSNGKLVFLHKEVELLENYIALEQLRYGEEIEISFNKTYTKNTRVIPLILLSIVENAFKHGASGSLEIPSIHIKLYQEGEIVFFEVKNSKNPTKQQDETGYSRGIGLSNIKQQLALLYPDFSYHVTDEKEWYHVALKINTEKINDQMYYS